MVFRFVLIFSFPIISCIFMCNQVVAQSHVYVGVFQYGGASLPTTVSYSSSGGSCTLTIAGSGGAAPVTASGSVEYTDDGCELAEVDFTSALARTFGVKLPAKCTFLRCEEERARPWEQNAIACYVQFGGREILISTDLLNITRR